MARDAFTLYKYHAYDHATEQFGFEVLASGLTAVAKGDIVTITADALNDNKLTLTKTNSIVAGSILVLRPFPDYGIPISRYSKQHTPIATGGVREGGLEIHGIKLKAGDEVVTTSTGAVTIL